ncbi:MAG: Asp23/Gls24 family envelope stress response protein [Actinobacteria bacterium]|nr:MAG: Asp23/Gls24 family envelope stress response protein [Actinomycetota bacterium]
MATISSDVLASYAADAAREVDGVRGLVESTLHRHKGVRVFEEGGRVRVELHVAVDWGASIPKVGREVQRRVGAYLAQMASVEAEAVDVVVDEVGPP